VILCLAALACLHAPVWAGAWSVRPPVSLVASPAHVSLAGAARQVVTVTSSGTQAVAAEIVKAGYGLDLRGRPRVLRPRSSWIAVRPRRLTLEPGGHASILVVSSPPRRAQPGDHPELVLLTTRPVRSAALAVRMRLGVVVVVRVAGRIVRRLEPVRVRIRPRRLELLIANRGNVTETIARRCITVTVRRSSLVLARLHPAPRSILPHTRGLLELPFRRPGRGRLSVAVALSPGPPCGRVRTRAFTLRIRPNSGR
jgi:hypothetical protein